MKVLVLIDDFAETRLGGMTQRQRLQSNLKADFAKLIESVFYYSEQDSTASLREYLGDLSEPVFLLKTSLVVSRRSLQSLCNALMIRLGPDSDLSWTALALSFDKHVPPMPELKTGEPYWEVLHRNKDFGAVEHRLMQTLRKVSDGYTSSKLNRPLSLWISKRLARFSIKPSQLTFVMAFLPFVFAVFLIQGTYMGFLWGTFLYQVTSVLDGCDGELARLKFLESKHGEWADSMADQLANHIFLLAIGIGLARQAGLATHQGLFYLFEGIVATALMMFVVVVVAKQTKQRSGARQFNDFGEDLFSRAPLPVPIQKLGLFISRLLRRDTYALAYFLLALMGHSVWILHFYALGIVGHVLALAYSHGKSFLFTPTQDARE